MMLCNCGTPVSPKSDECWRCRVEKAEARVVEYLESLRKQSREIHEKNGRVAELEAALASADAEASEDVRRLQARVEELEAVVLRQKGEIAFAQNEAAAGAHAQGRKDVSDLTRGLINENKALRERLWKAELQAVAWRKVATSFRDALRHDAAARVARPSEVISARLDPDGTAKPLTEIVAIMPEDGRGTVHAGQATHYVARPTGECPSEAPHVSIRHRLREVAAGKLDADREAEAMVTEIVRLRARVAYLESHVSIEKITRDLEALHEAVRAAPKRSEP